MRWTIPNILTGIRLAAGVVMFLLLAGATSGFPFVSGANGSTAKPSKKIALIVTPA